MAQVTNLELKDDIIIRLETKLKGVGTVKGDITNAFMSWFQGLVAAGSQSQMGTEAPAEQPQEEGGGQ